MGCMPAGAARQCCATGASASARRRTLRDPRLDDVAAVLRVALQADLVQPPLALAHLRESSVDSG